MTIGRKLTNKALQARLRAGITIAELHTERTGTPCKARIDGNEIVYDLRHILGDTVTLTTIRGKLK